MVAICILALSPTVVQFYFVVLLFDRLPGVRCYAVLIGGPEGSCHFRVAVGIVLGGGDGLGVLSILVSALHDQIALFVSDCSFWVQSGSLMMERDLRHFILVVVQLSLHVKVVLVGSLVLMLYCILLLI